MCVCADLLKRVLDVCCVRSEESVEMFVCLCRSSEESVEMFVVCADLLKRG